MGRQLFHKCVTKLFTTAWIPACYELSIYANPRTLKPSDSSHNVPKAEVEYRKIDYLFKPGLNMVW